MAFEIHSEHKLVCPIDIVWPIVEDLAHWVDWTRAIVPIGSVPVDPWTPGCALLLQLMLPVPKRLHIRVLACEPGARLAWEGTEGGVTHRTELGFEVTDYGTLMHHDVALGGALLPLFRVMRGSTFRENLLTVFNADLERRALQVESQHRIASDLGCEI